MLPLTSAAPTTAERIRSACAGADGALLAIENTDARSRDYEKIKDRFRPGHADYTYQQKYGTRP